MRIEPLGDKVVVKRTEAEEMTSGGIVLPDAAREKPQEGRVLSVGNGRLLDDGTRGKLQVSEGDHIGLVGPNGSGKSSLLRMLASAIEPGSLGLRAGGGGILDLSGVDTVTADVFEALAEASQSSGSGGGGGGFGGGGCACACAGCACACACAGGGR